MHKSFYTSGFVYNHKTHRILLLHTELKDDKVPTWSTIGGESLEGEQADTTFQRIINNLLDLDLKPKDIFPIYDYIHPEMEKPNFVFYAQIKKPINLDSKKMANLSWVSFSETLKFVFTSQAKRDVMIGERVINLKRRVELNLQQPLVY